MTAPKGKRAVQAAAKPPATRATPTPQVASTPVTTVPPASGESVNGKKKKKKKGKGKGVAGPEFYEDEEDEDTLPPLEPMNGSVLHHHHHGQTRSTPRTGLSPELESVHLSTTASLSASVAAARRMSPAARAEAELLATADHLARSMDNDPDGGVNDEYWASFPDHLRNFVRHTYSQLSSGGNEDEKTQAMYAIAQQIHSGVGVNLNATATTKGMTTTTRYSTTTTTTTATFPASLPFDSSIFSDPAFTLAMEQAAAANGLHTGTDRGNMPPANVMLLNEYGSEDHDYAEGDYYSDDEGDDGIDGRGRTASFTVNYKETVVHDGASPDSPAKGRKNKKKKRKGGGGDGTPQSAPDSPAAPGDVGTGKGVSRGVPVSAGVVPPVPPSSVSAPNLTGGAPPGSGRMPTQRQQQTPNPPPSSRAAGKQPMAYSTPAPANPPPSRRAASKAPITSHAYSHNHAHHHPSPPSSNASAPHKPRPPANGTPQNVPAKNSKIWSTSSTEERERIKEFWLALSEEERRSLVKIEKEAVLRKMKEQQKHSCTCAVCGRKRFVVFISSDYKFFSLTAFCSYLLFFLSSYFSYLYSLSKTQCATPTLFFSTSTIDRTTLFYQTVTVCTSHVVTPPRQYQKTTQHPPHWFIKPLNSKRNEPFSKPISKNAKTQNGIDDETGMQLRKSSRYCTMLITRSLNSTRTISSDTSPLAALSLHPKGQAPSLAA